MNLKRFGAFFNALADPTRLRILSLLGEGELCVCDVMSVLKEPQSKVSRHLSHLRRAKLVEARRQGLWMHYRLSKPGTKAFAIMLEAFRRGRSDFGELEKDLKEYRRNRGCLVACCG